ncbi:hypothetical protein P5V15_007252 [Pogonomyrmex californicus]
MLYYMLSVFSFVTLGLSTSGQFTPPLITCKRDSDNYSACLKHAIQEAWPRFNKGIPEIGFPPLDPLVFKYGKIIVNSDEIHAEVGFTNLTYIGLSEAHFSDVRTHFLDNDVFRLEVNTDTPKLQIKGFVTAMGTLGPFRLNSKGPFIISLDDVVGTWDLIGDVVNDTWIVKNFTYPPSPRKFRLNADNLIEGNKVLNDLILGFVNEFWPPLYRTMLPAMIKMWDPWLVDIANNFFSKVSFSQLFP